VSQQRFFSNEHIRVALSLLFLIIAAPLVVTSDGSRETLFYLGWILFGLSLMLPLWSRFRSTFHR